MGLQANQEHIQGRDQKLYIMRETTPGTFVKAVTSQTIGGQKGGGALNCLTTTFTPDQKRKDRIDAYMASRQVTERITDKTEHSWAYSGFYVPSGTKNIPPDVSGLITAAMGTQTINANDVTYTLSSTQSMLTLSMVRQFQDDWQEALAGCLVEELKMSFSGGEEPRIEASGRAMTFASTSYTTLNGAMSATATMVVDDFNFAETNAAADGTAGAGAHSVVQVGDDTNSSAGFDVEADDGAGTFTLGDNVTDEADAAAVIPFVPTHTDAGSPISGTNGTFTHDSFSAVLTGFEFTIKQNFKYFDDEAFQLDLRDAAPNFRDITGTMSFRVRRDHLIHIQNRTALTTRAISLIVGGAAQSGTRLQISLPQVEVEWSEVSIPETEEATISLPFKALDSGSLNDAISIIHT